MSTRSEIETLIESSKVFLDGYCHLSLKVKNGSQEQECCDCLIEFQDFYIVIQIKERADSANLDYDLKWFDSKVLKKAKSQIKDAINYLKNENSKFFKDGKEITLGLNKTIFPVIIFENSRITNYNRVVYSKTLGDYINIFNIEDFKVMLDTIKIPYDIVNYLHYRKLMLDNNDLINKLMIDDVNENVTIMHKIETEKDFAEHYILQTYLFDTQDISVLNSYTEILNILSHQFNFQKNPLLDLLLCVDHKLASKLVKMWNEAMNRCLKKEEVLKPLRISLANHAALLFSDSGVLGNEFNIYVERYSRLFSYKHSIENIHILVFKPSNGGCLIEYMCTRFNHVDKNDDYDELVEKYTID